MAAWRPNSALGHATARSADGPYTLKRLIKPHFVHEPVALRAADGTVLIWHIGNGSNTTGPGSNYATNCTGGCTGSDHKWEGGGTFYGPTSVLYSASFDGPWASLNAGFGSELPGCPQCVFFIFIPLPTSCTTRFHSQFCLGRDNRSIPISLAVYFLVRISHEQTSHRKVY